MKEHQKICMVCKKPYIAKRSDGMYCGGACKEQAFLKRNGWAAPNKEQLMNENRVLKRAVELYMDFTISIFPSLNEDVKEIIIGINTEMKMIIQR